MGRGIANDIHWQHFCQFLGILMARPAYIWGGRSLGILMVKFRDSHSSAPIFRFFTTYFNCTVQALNWRSGDLRA